MTSFVANFKTKIMTLKRTLKKVNYTLSNNNLYELVAALLSINAAENITVPKIA